MKTKSILAIAFALVLSLVLFAGCTTSGNLSMDAQPLSSGGVLCLKVNPEIAVFFDNNGNVTKIESRNQDAKAIIEDYTGFEGKAAREVVADLVGRIGNAGYFTEEIEGNTRRITIEIEPGSKLPNGTFLEDVVADVQAAVAKHNWNSPVDIEANTDYGVTDYTDYDDTDYGPNNDGVTDYTDYDDTDYGPNNDGVTDYTDYDDTDYGPNNDGVTDYTDYDDTDYEESDYGKTDYTDYGDSDYTGN